MPERYARPARDEVYDSSRLIIRDGVDGGIVWKCAYYQLRSGTWVVLRYFTYRTKCQVRERFESSFLNGSDFLIY